jgi:hypothetical protein
MKLDISYVKKIEVKEAKEITYGEGRKFYSQSIIIESGKEKLFLNISSNDKMFIPQIKEERRKTEQTEIQEEKGGEKNKKKKSKRKDKN